MCSTRRWRQFGAILVVVWWEIAVLAGVTLAAAPETNEHRIEVALTQSSSAEFIQTPLEDVVAYLAEYHSIPIQIDLQALEAIGVDEHEPITLSADGISLESMLERILDPYGVTWTVRHDCLVITSKEAARESVSIRIYLVADLTGPSEQNSARPHEGDPFGAGYGGTSSRMTGGGSSSPADLLDAITNTIEPESWGEEGPGRASVLLVGGRTVLVIRQNYQTHRMIDRFLDALRDLGKEAPEADTPRDAGPSRRSAPVEANPFGVPAPAGPKPSGPRPADDPFGAPTPKRNPPADDPFAARPPVRTPNNPFAGGASVPTDDPFGAPVGDKARPHPTLRRDDPFGSAPANPFGPGPAGDPFAIPDKK